MNLIHEIKTHCKYGMYLNSNCVLKIGCWLNLRCDKCYKSNFRVNFNIHFIIVNIIPTLSRGLSTMYSSWPYIPIYVRPQENMAASGREYGFLWLQRCCCLRQQPTVAASGRKSPRSPQWATQKMVSIV